MISSTRYTGHIGAIYALCSDHHNGLYSGAGDRIVARWDLQTPGDGELIVRAGDAVYALCLLRGTETLLVGTGNGGIHVISLTEKNEEHLLQLHDTSVFSIVEAPDGKVFCTTGGDGLLNIVTTEDFTTRYRIRLTESKLRTLVFHPQLPLALAGCGDGTVVSINTETWQPMERLGAHQPGFSVNCICFTPDGRYYLTGSRDAHLHLYETESNRLIERIPAHNYAIYSIAFDPTGRYFATASRDKTVKRWNLSTMEVMERLEANDGKGHVNSVNTLIWLNNGKLLTAGDDRAIQLWE